MNTVILTKLRVQSIHDVDITARTSNKLRGDKIRLGAVYICDDTHDEILETIFKGIITLRWIDFGRISWKQ